MPRCSATSCYHADGLGSVISLSSSAGAIANSYTYDSFGKLTASTGPLVNPFQYTARESDTETGLYYYRARYYDTNAGRFLSEDSIRWKGGSSAFYSYVSNSPTIHVDPKGHDIGVVGDAGSYVSAVNYLSQAPGMASILRGLGASAKYLEIRTNSNCETSFDHVHLILNWDPHCALRCSKSGCGISPALALGHELAHAFHQVNDNLTGYRRWKSNPDFDNAEEQFAIQGSENNAAITLGECMRTSHHGDKYRVPMPLSH